MKESIPLKYKKVLLIDYATAGTAGSYINEYHEILKNISEVDVAVNYYFPYKYGYKYFFKFSDLTVKRIYKFPEFLRLVIRLFELLFGFLRIYSLNSKKKYNLIIYALSTNMKVELIFLKMMKRIFKVDIWIIAHDVIPFIFSYEDLEKKIKNRLKFFNFADRIIVHNDNSIYDLHNVLKISKLKIHKIKFPVFDLNYLNKNEQNEFSLPKDYFLFIGHLREEKGIDILLKAWDKYSLVSNNNLVIAGKIPRGSRLTKNDFDKKNLIFINEYIDDYDFRNLIDNAKSIILPYKRATNSGILFSVISRKKNLILSDIDLFRDNPLVNKRFLFKNGDSEDLVKKLILISKMEEEEVKFYEKKIELDLINYLESFRNDIINLLK